MFHIWHIHNPHWTHGWDPSIITAPQDHRLGSADKRDGEAKVAKLVAILIHEEGGKQGHISTRLERVVGDPIGNEGGL